jgi:hypothetical protein
VIREFDLGKACCRVWLSELPMQKVGYDAITEKRYPASQTLGIATGFKVAAEVLIPRGGRSLYGLLGGEFLPAAGDQLLVSVPTLKTASTLRYQGALAEQFDMVSCGLLNEYAEFVIQGVDAAVKERSELSSGSLSMVCSAYGEVSSNSQIFESLGYWITRTWGDPEAICDPKIMEEALPI